MKIRHDKNGVPIHPGDLLKTYHFRDYLGRDRYLYHVAVIRDGELWMVPVSHMHPPKIKGGGDCMITNDIVARAEIIHGTDDGGGTYEERPKLEAPAGEGGKP